MRWQLIVLGVFCACSPASDISVVEGERDWGGVLPDGTTFSASISTLVVTRNAPAPFTQDDLGAAILSARSYCAGRDLVFEGEGADIESRLPQFANNRWELAGGCKSPVAAL